MLIEPINKNCYHACQGLILYIEKNLLREKYLL